MRYSSTINNVKALEWELTIQQAYLFAWFYELPSWADKVVIGNDIFYFAAKSKAVEELPILTNKTDTMYRYYKQLESLNLVVIKKIDSKDYIALTAKGKTWNYGKSEYSENNPSELGNKSESSSDKNPTYNNIISNPSISNNNAAKQDFAGDLFNQEQLNNKAGEEKQKKVAPKKIKEFSPEVKQCYKTCLTHFEEHLRPSNKKEQEAWLDIVDKLNRIDNIPFEMITEIVAKTRADDFWAKNFLSLAKLRKKNKEGVLYIVVFSEQFKKRRNVKSEQEQQQLDKEALDYLNM